MPRLKSLELHGYKTFASKTLFEFPGSITAVVGPNGSGKSNIADSIRWVLGEQAFSLLRGKKTEDMIFTGSEDRPRASMASSTIIFNNEDGWLPIDFNEVAITRRAYRDGDNEYLINNQRVRLKEINELLSQSGLSERTYTVIGQGLVDAALSLKPEERRKFFEEAAGIGLYRSRRDEALNRLENTRRNIERVNDILAEIKPRIASLERQARRAQEFDRLKADLRLLLRDWYGFQWHRTQTEFIASRDSLKTHESQLRIAQQKMQEVELQQSSSREVVQALRKQLDEWHRTLAELHLKREEVSRNLAVLDERINAHKEKDTTIKLDFDRLKTERDNLIEEQKSLENNKADLDKELEEANTQKSIAEQKLQAKKQELDKWEKELSVLRNEKVKSESELIRAKAHIVELSNRLEGLNKNKEQISSITKDIEVKLNVLRTDISRYSSDIKKNEAVRNEISQHCIEAKGILDGLENSLQKENEKLNELIIQKSRLNAKLEVLIASEMQLMGSEDGIKNLFEDSRKGRTPSNLELINKLLIVPEKYEQAIAGALGDYFDSLIIENPEESENLLAYIEKTNKSRVHLLPKNIKDDRIMKENTDPDKNFIRASEVINCPEGYQKIINILLAHVLIVNDRKEARQLIGKVPLDYKVVTLIGEVFDANGMITAGKEKRTALVGRPRQKQELEKNIHDLEINIQDAQKAVDVFREKRVVAVENVERVNSELETLDAKLQLNQSLLLKNQNEYNQEEHRFQLYTEQVRAIDEQYENVNNEIIQEKSGIETTNSAVSKNSDEITALTSKVRDNPLDEIQQLVVHWTTRKAVLMRASSDFDDRVNEKNQSLEKNAKAAASLQKTMSEMHSLYTSYINDQIQLQKIENEIQVQISDLQQKTTPAEMDLNAKEILNRSFQTEQDAARQAFSINEKYFTQAQIEASRQKDRIERLREKIVEDFGLVAFDYVSDVSGPNPLPFEGLVEQLPTLSEIPDDLEENINRQRAQLRRMGPINQEAEKEFAELSERYTFLSSQVEDLTKAENDLHQIITELDGLMKTEFKNTFEKVATEFHLIFSRLFTGGTAKLIMTESEHSTDTGVDIEARLPGRREQGLSLLSGGERSLTAAALVFALLKVSPTPFCILDEVDAMLDEANVGRFCDLLVELSEKTQFILITHNRNTVQVADVIYGVTMGKDSASQVISLKMDELTDELVK